MEHSPSWEWKRHNARRARGSPIRCAKLHGGPPWGACKVGEISEKPRGSVNYTTPGFPQSVLLHSVSNITAFWLVMILAYFQHSFQRTSSTNKLLVHAPNMFLADHCSCFWLWKKSKPKFNRKPKDGIDLTGKLYYESTNAQPCLFHTCLFSHLPLGMDHRAAALSLPLARWERKERHIIPSKAPG